LDIQIPKNLTIGHEQRPQMHHCANFAKIGEKVAEISNFVILDLRGAFWDHPLRVLEGLHHLTKFGLNQLSNFCNKSLNILCV